MSNPLADREIVIAVGGGIAAYKVAAMTSGLVQRSAHVSVVMTRNSRKFIGAATFAALTGRPVASRSFDPNNFPLGAHIELAERAELVVVARRQPTSWQRQRLGWLTTCSRRFYSVLHAQSLWRQR